MNSYRVLIPALTVLLCILITIVACEKEIFEPKVEQTTFEVDLNDLKKYKSTSRNRHTYKEYADDLADTSQFTGSPNIPFNNFTWAGVFNHWTIEEYVTEDQWKYINKTEKLIDLWTIAVASSWFQQGYLPMAGGDAIAPRSTWNEADKYEVDLVSTIYFDYVRIRYKVADDLWAVGWLLPDRYSR